MPDVAGFAEEDGVFPHVDGEVADALERACHEDEVEQVLRTPVGGFQASAQGGDHLFVQAVEFFVAGFEAFPEFGVRVGVGRQCVAQELVRQGVERLGEGGFFEGGCLADFLGALGDAYGVVRDTFEVVGHFHRGDDEPQVGGDGMEADEDVHAALVDSAFEVIDIGINNPVEKYLDALELHKPDILGMSALLTTTMPYMKVVIDTLKQKNLREKYIVLVGGAPLNDEFGKAVGADAYCRDAAVAVETAKALIAAKRAAARMTAATSASSAASKRRPRRWPRPERM